MTGTTRIVISLTDDELADVKQRAAANHRSVNEEIRRAIAVTRSLDEVTSGGEQLLVEQEKRGGAPALKKLEWEGK
jgi:hypothetical protein